MEVLPLRRKLVQTTLVLWFITILAGCETMTKVGTTGATAAVGAAVAGPAGAVGGAMVGDAAGELIIGPIMGIAEKKQMVEEKVDSVWSLLAKLGEQAAWLIGAIVLFPILLPLLIGYIIPSPGDRKRRKK
jgi:hypothetical protein